MLIKSKLLDSPDATLCGDTADRFGHLPLDLVGRSGRHPSPDTRRPDQKSLQAEAQPVEAPGACTARGFFLWRSSRVFPAARISSNDVSRGSHSTNIRWRAEMPGTKTG